MQSLYRFTAPASKCGYLPDRDWSLEYEMVADLSAAEYAELLAQGWRRFGAMLFRPQCPTCQACQTLRVDVAAFQPNRSQTRTWKQNIHEVTVHVGPPRVSRARLDLYDRFHEMQTEVKGWPEHGAKDAASYRESFVENPAFTEEWCYFVGERLVGVGYVDRLLDCMSAIYYFYDPDLRERSLGTFNVLCLLEECKRARFKYLYLGYYVEGCRSLQYKANFKPNQIRRSDGTWLDFGR
jgi:arginine-tRNA-protein transferase